MKLISIFQTLDGGRTRARTLDPLIKSQLLYQLSYAPIELTGPGPGKARHVAKAGWAVQPQSGGKFPGRSCRKSAASDRRVRRRPPYLFRRNRVLGQIEWRVSKSGPVSPRMDRCGRRNLARRRYKGRGRQPATSPPCGLLDRNRRQPARRGWSSPTTKNASPQSPSANGRRSTFRAVNTTVDITKVGDAYPKVIFAARS